MHSLRRQQCSAGCSQIVHDTHSMYRLGHGGWLAHIGLRLLMAVVLLSTWFQPSLAMDQSTRENLRDQTVELFYHGYDNYLRYAFPEDELRPVSCAPLTRDRENPAHIELNDVLGNYSLTLIDSLSTLAIIASSASNTGRDPLDDFQNGVKLLVEYYGDGSDGPSGVGKRARGFDLDSKVQVFETVIRGVGGLLSGHLFAIGDLPIRNYSPIPETKGSKSGIHWDNGMIYDGQLLRLAQDLAERLLPAFYTSTGLPYPRVNLRHGVSFYPNSPLNQNGDGGECPKDQSGREITETCSAGAGSLVLEFSTLSRLTGDDRFENMAKNAFWSVWKRRSAIGLIGSGIDAESGLWVTPYTGIGAGIDSFFEYALKSHILLSGLPYNTDDEKTHSPDEFLFAWEESHQAIRRHIYRGQMFQHPHYIQADLYTGAAKAFWIDSLSAYYPGVLTLAGELEEATTTHMLYTALWSRYAALPERWSTTSGDIESGLRWWGGRPEFVESSWYLYRATKDPWYLHIGEMVLSDINRRCWTKCGWAGLQDVNTGEKNDRMESFFLGETAKYLFLLFDHDHPLNTLDSSFVFTTEGHPLIIRRRKATKQVRSSFYFNDMDLPICPKPPAAIPLTGSSMAARNDIFHAAHLAKTHLKHTFSPDALASPTNYTYFPWTLPLELIPADGVCTTLKSKLTFELSFPTLQDMPPSLMSVQRVSEGIYVSSISGVRFGMVKEAIDPFETSAGDVFRIYSVSSVNLGRDELVFLNREALLTLNPVDHYFTRMRDSQRVDLVIDLIPEHRETNKTSINLMDSLLPDVNINLSNKDPSMLASLIKQLQSMLKESLTPTISPTKPTPTVYRHVLEASMPTGPGAAPIESLDNEPPALLDHAVSSPLRWNLIYISPHNLCTETLAGYIPREYQVIVAPRGGCSFAKKLEHIPSFPPSPTSLQIVIIISYPEHEGRSSSSDHVRYGSTNPYLIQPFLDTAQMTPAGLPRAHPIPMVMLPGGKETMDMMEKAGGIALRRRWWFESQGVRIDNLIVL